MGVCPEMRPLWAWRRNEKKDRNFHASNWLFAQTTHVDIAPVHGSRRCGGRKSPSPIDLAHGLYNSLYYGTSRDVTKFVLFSMHVQKCMDRTTCRPDYLHAPTPILDTPKICILLQNIETVRHSTKNTSKVGELGWGLVFFRVNDPVRFLVRPITIENGELSICTKRTLLCNANYLHSATNVWHPQGVPTPQVGNPSCSETGLLHKRVTMTVQRRQKLWMMPQSRAWPTLLLVLNDDWLRNV